MKFLKKDSTEAGYVQDIVTNLALSKPDISFTFVKDGTEVFSTVGDGNLLNTIASVFSTEYANTLTKVDYETEKFKITGYTTVPHGSRQSRNMQFSFVNSRYVKNKTIISAVENAYKGTDVYKRQEFPLGKFICVTGVSGSGKSSLVNEILYKKTAMVLNHAKARPGKHDDILGLENLDKVICIDQNAIGRTPRSNPATYTGVFNDIRTLFAMTNDAKVRGYGPGRFSFNVKGGRCEACEGDGIAVSYTHLKNNIEKPPFNGRYRNRNL